MSYPLSVEGVSAALAALGGTATAVALRLYAGGHLGIPGDCKDCPTAHYLRAAFPRALDVTVSEGAVGVYVSPGLELLVLVPDPVTQFIERFDNAEFLELREHPFAEPAATS